MRRTIAAFIRLACAVWLAACAALPPLPVADSGPRTHAVRVVSNGWHTAIVVARGDLAATGLLPETDDFPDAAFLEFGWGDRAYYPAAQPTFGMALDALLTETPAVMHMAGLARLPEHSYTDAETLPVPLTAGAFRRLAGAIAGQFERTGGSRAAPVARGLYPDSNFYDARGGFHLFNTCNTWTARMLRAAGIDLSPSGIVTADDLMSRLRAALDRPPDGSG